MKNWPIGIPFVVGGSLFGRALLFLTALALGIGTVACFANGGLVAFESIIGIMAIFAIASLFHLVSAALLLCEFLLGLTYTLSEGRHWMLAAIGGLAAIHTFYLLSVLE